jgi:hypothetical protein
MNFHLAQLEVINAGADGFVNLTIDVDKLSPTEL